MDSETGLYYYGARYLDPKYSHWLSPDPAMGDYIPQAPVNDEARKHNQNLPGQGGIFNTVNLQVYHYAGNNPIKYTDPDGMDITNNTNNYIVARLEDSITLPNGHKIDTAIFAPNDTIRGGIDGAKDKEGNFFKVSAHLLPEVEE